MKKVIPFTKTITFKTMISEITDISVKHELKLEANNEVKGDILVDGKYKVTDASILEEEFHYRLPFIIAIDPKYTVDDVEINITDFNFEIQNEEDLKLDVEIELDNIYEKEEVRNEIEIPVETEELIDNMEISDNNEEDKENTKSNITSIFSNLNQDNETFSSYHVYIVRDNDTLEYIMDKYNVSRDELADYNDLNNIVTGSKLIIPCSND